MLLPTHAHLRAPARPHLRAGARSCAHFARSYAPASAFCAAGRVFAPLRALLRASARSRASGMPVHACASLRTCACFCAPVRALSRFCVFTRLCAFQRVLRVCARFCALARACSRRARARARVCTCALASTRPSAPPRAFAPLCALMRASARSPRRCASGQRRTSGEIARSGRIAPRTRIRAHRGEFTPIIAHSGWLAPELQFGTRWGNLAPSPPVGADARRIASPNALGRIPAPDCPFGRVDARSRPDCPSGARAPDRAQPKKAEVFCSL